MITIQVLGLDQFVVGHYSREHTDSLASLFGVDDTDLVFYAPNSMIFHKGVEQTSWNTVVNILCSKKFAPKEKAVAEYILRTLSEFSINVQVVFSYFQEGSEYEHINPDYPRYLQEDNLKEAEINVDYGIPNVDYDDEDDEEGAEPQTHDDGNPDDLSSIYLGNAFEGFEEALEEQQRKKKS